MNYQISNWIRCWLSGLSGVLDTSSTRKSKSSNFSYSQSFSYEAEGGVSDKALKHTKNDLNSSSDWAGMM